VQERKVVMTEGRSSPGGLLPALLGSGPIRQALRCTLGSASGWSLTCGPAATSQGCEPKSSAPFLWEMGIAG
jgi:hypothetical protein